MIPTLHRLVSALSILTLLACSGSASRPTGSEPRASAPFSESSASAPRPPPEPSVEPKRPALSVPAAALPRPAFDPEQLIFGSATAPACALHRPVEVASRIDCWLGASLAADSRAAALARDLYTRHRVVIGIAPESWMDGGWRGQIHLVPQRPVGVHRRHLQWLARAFDTYEQLFEALELEAPAFFFRDVGVRFMRSVGRTTPSASARGRLINYNVSGSLHSSRDAVTRTIFHELFHLNDEAQGDWSRRHLSELYTSLLERCSVNGRLSSSCLAPFAPHTTMVRGGTFYAFQPGNGVGEYAAELAVRYFDEQRQAVRGRPPRRPFKCGPRENAAAWGAMVERFFAGRDRVPPCH
ncbi:MAG: hypothetical protein AAGA56_05285 [Myxococcota bacterium]